MILALSSVVIILIAIVIIATVGIPSDPITENKPEYIVDDSKIIETTTASAKT